MKSKIFVIIFVLLMSVQSQAEQSNEQDWRELAQKIDLSENTILKLEKNNVVITDESYKQIFTPYIQSSMTFFVTTDSLINAYHVLYEESILRLEKANASRLEGILEFVLNNFPKADDNIKDKPEVVKAAHERALIVVGTAMKLLNENYKPANGDIEKIINEEVEKIKQAAANEKPSWLGEPTDDLIEIDYSRYKPRGFYTKSEQLSKYFRAVSWLQSIPFRLSHDDELLSILMLGDCLDTNKFGTDTKKYQDYTNFFSAFKMFIGMGDDWDVITAKEQVNGNLNGSSLSNIRAKLEQKIKEEGGSLINDQVRFPPLRPDTVAAEPQLRFISAYCTPDAVMFHKTTDLREFERSFPTGLEVCVALGSEFAKSKLEYSDKEKLLKTIEDAKDAFSGNSLYLDYLQCLSCLLDEPTEESPAFMKNDAWQAKSCNTTLAGWSQLRHTWSLQAKQSVTYMGMVSPPTGFVEPEPEFYNEMAQLAQKTKELLSKSGALETNYKQMSDDIMYYAEVVQKSNFKVSVIDLPRNEWERFEFVSGLLYRLKIIDGQTRRDDYSQKNIDDLRRIAIDLLENKLPEDTDLQKRIRDYDYNIKELWNSLESMSRTLAEIAQKQLDGEGLNQYERFLKSYGINLAKIMFYNKNSYEGPKDDAMRIVDVHYAPSEGYLETGIARPRAIYVLYPWQGDLVLCRGAVMPYCEFVSDTRLTDDDWKRRLNSPKVSGIPEWMGSVISDKKLTRPSFVKITKAEDESERIIYEAAAKQLNINVEELMEDDFDKITELKLSLQGPVNIKGIGRFSNLQRLQITGGEIDSLLVVVLNLRYNKNIKCLELSDNNLKDIGILSGIATLQSLDLHGTQADNVENLDKLENLKILNLNNTNIRDIVPISKLNKLEELYLSGTKINDIKPLANLKNLKTLDIRDTKVNENQITSLKKLLPRINIISY